MVANQVLVTGIWRNRSGVIFMLQRAYMLLDYQNLYSICSNSSSKPGVYPWDQRLQDSFRDVSTLKAHQVQENIVEHSQFVNPNLTTAKPYNILFSGEQFTSLYIKQQFS